MSPDAQLVYPQRPTFKNKWERYIFTGMILYSMVIYLQIACYYVWGGK